MWRLGATWAVAVVGMLVSACGNGSSNTSTATGLTQAQAVTKAEAIAQPMSATPVTFVSAASGPFSRFEPRDGRAVSAPDRLVWSIVVSGSFRGSCGGAGSGTCPPPNTTERVELDYTSGDFITSKTPADAQ